MRDIRSLNFLGKIVHVYELYINRYFSNLTSFFFNLISTNRATTMARQMLMMGIHDEIICGH